MLAFESFLSPTIYFIQNLDWRKRIDSVQVLQEFYVTVTRKVAQPIRPDEAAELIRDLSYWRIYSPTALDILGAIDLQTLYRISFWDAMVVHSALCLGCSVIWSEDLSDGQAYHQVIVKNPFQV